LEVKETGNKSLKVKFTIAIGKAWIAKDEKVVRRAADFTVHIDNSKPMRKGQLCDESFLECLLNGKDMPL
jgi:hypothetical protein